MSKFNFDDANRLRTLAASKGVGSKEWIEFANMMFDRFPEIYDTAKSLNDRYMNSVEAEKDAALINQQRDELLAAFKELDAALNRAWNERRLPWDVLTGEEVRRYKAAIAKAEQ